MTKLFGKLFLINFAVGVVTGIVQEFQFGMNWSACFRFVGDVFGAPLAMEGLLAFFMESVFIRLWIFGLSNSTALAAWPHVIFASSLVAGLVLIAASAWHLARRSETDRRVLINSIGRYGMVMRCGC